MGRIKQIFLWGLLIWVGDYLNGLGCSSLWDMGMGEHLEACVLRAGVDLLGNESKHPWKVNIRHN